MVTADLITGFLGSGKTTFIRKYVQYLLKQGEKICILENDYGAINVDTMLLSDLRSEKLGIEMVAGGNDYDCHRRRFRTKLITMAMLGYTRVVIEPSGIFDVDEFFDILHEDPLDRRYRIGNVIAVVKANLEDDFSEETDYLLASQAAQAGCVVLSHAQETDTDTIVRTCGHINEALAAIRCRRTFEPGKSIIAKDWETFTDEDLRRIASSGYWEASFEKRFSMDDNDFKALFFMNIRISEKEVLDRIRKLFTDPAAGRVIRVKGFLRAEDESGGWHEINATEKETKIRPLPDGQEVLIVIGEHLDEEVVDGYFPAKYSTVHLR